MDEIKRERKRRLRMEREYREHVRRKERLRAFLTYLRSILPLIKDCEARGLL
ncbi:MAG: hypothetical protein GXO00_01945 [Candidatus Diapherotrites archaeon]|nr:hypothetical protein [Candidatus Diapherotrites archaeon]